MDGKRILHVCFSGYSEGYSYQENLLTQYHKKMGLEVYVFTSDQYLNGRSQQVRLLKPQTYVNEFGVNVKTFNSKFPQFLNRKLSNFKGLKSALKEVSPDIIFMHGVQGLYSLAVAEYVKKNPNVKLFVDNHADFSNSARSWTSRELLHKIIWRFCARRIEPYVTKFYGVLPARVDFLVDMYRLPREKVELLVMGADDKLVEKASDPTRIKEARTQLSVSVDDFLIVTGGKIDSAKKQTLLLMDAVNQLSQEVPIKLVLFGSVIPELKESVLQRCSNNVRFVGWLSSEETYRYLAPADLVVFPGRHSVLWEQTAGMGKPMIVKYWEGTTHIDKGGNVSFLYEDSVDELKVAISSAIKNIREMTEVAERNKNVFSYNDIARRSLQDDRIVS